MKLPFWVDEQLCVRLVLALGHFLWQGLVLAALAWGAAILMRRAAARWRYLVHLIALVLMIACLPVTFLSLSPEQELDFAFANLPTEITPVTEPLAASQSIHQEAATLPSDIPPIPDPPTPLAPAEPFRWHNFAPHLIAIYLLGVLIMIVRFSLGLRGSHRLRRSARPVDDPQLLRIFAEQVRAMRLRLQPTLAWCDRVAVPTVLGIFRPVVLLPLTFSTGLSPRQIEAVLIHELAHLRRWDHAVNLLQRVIESLLFFHPGVWYVSHRLRVEREHCCDDAALATGIEPASYAASLLELARHGLHARQTGDLAMNATGNPRKLSQLGQRIHRMLDQQPHEQFRLLRTWPILLLIVLSLGTATSFLFSASADQITNSSTDSAATDGDKKQDENGVENVPNGEAPSESTDASAAMPEIRNPAIQVLKLQLDKLLADRDLAQTEYTIAMKLTDKDPMKAADAQMAAARMKQIDAEIALIRSVVSG